MAHHVAFNIFMAVPFLYELRELLDWTCTATTLDWYDWLKLQDIRSSLFVATCRQQKGKRQTGDKVPPVMKFLQGFLLLTALFAVLWLPLLSFSSGAPTYQIPTLIHTHLNVSFHSSAHSGGADSVSNFQVYQSGGRHTTQNWAQGLNTSSPDADGADLLPQSLAALYTPDQVKLMCLAQGPDTSLNADGADLLRQSLAALYTPDLVKLMCLAQRLNTSSPDADGADLLPQSLAALYTPDQVKLMCLAQRLNTSSPDADGADLLPQSLAALYTPDQVKLMFLAQGPDTSPDADGADLVPQSLPALYTPDKDKRMYTGSVLPALYTPDQDKRMCTGSVLPALYTPDQDKRMYTGSVLPALYTPDKVKLMCLAQDSQQLWTMSPPGRAALAEALDSDGASIVHSCPGGQGVDFNRSRAPAPSRESRSPERSLARGSRARRARLRRAAARSRDSRVDPSARSNIA
eukprot:gene12051-15156_t